MLGKINPHLSCGCVVLPCFYAKRLTMAQVLQQMPKEAEKGKRESIVAALEGLAKEGWRLGGVLLATEEGRGEEVGNGSAPPHTGPPQPMHGSLCQDHACRMEPKGLQWEEASGWRRFLLVDRVQSWQACLVCLPPMIE